MGAHVAQLQTKLQFYTAVIILLLFGFVGWTNHRFPIASKPFHQFCLGKLQVNKLPEYFCPSNLRKTEEILQEDVLNILFCFVLFFSFGVLLLLLLFDSKVEVEML